MVVSLPFLRAIAIVALCSVSLQSYAIAGYGPNSAQPDKINESIIAPTTPIAYTDDGRLVPETVSSYLVPDSPIGYCSYITRMNLIQIGEAFGYKNEYTPKGNAYSIIQNLQLSNQLERFKNTKSGLDLLQKKYNQTGATVYDIYRYTPDRFKTALESDVAQLSEKNPRFQSFYNRGHRAMVFLGSDNIWYVLDPLGGTMSDKPQLFTEYFPRRFGNKEWYISTRSYRREPSPTFGEFTLSLPFLSSDLTQVFQPLTPTHTTLFVREPVRGDHYILGIPPIRVVA